MCKTKKTALLHAIERDVPRALSDHATLRNTALMVDAMALIQALPDTKIPITFGQLSAMILHCLISRAGEFHATRVDFVGDWYLETSIKSLERTRRCQSATAQLTIYNQEQQTLWQWTKFFRSRKTQRAAASLSSYDLARKCVEANSPLVYHRWCWVQGTEFPMWWQTWCETHRRVSWSMIMKKLIPGPSCMLCIHVPPKPLQ